MEVKITSAVLATLFISGCASNWGESGGSLCDSKMTQLGPDTYMASAVWGNGCGSHYKIAHAGVYCSRMYKEILINNIDNNPEGNVIFQCLRQGDRDLQRPKYEKPPDIIIKKQ